MTNNSTNNKTRYEIGNRIHKYREDSGLSQTQLAEKIGVRNSRVSNWEKGLNRPDADMLAEICVALNVSPSLLLGIQISSEELNECERKVIQEYRAKADMQRAVNVLLGIEKA